LDNPAPALSANSSEEIAALRLRGATQRRKGKTMKKLMIAIFAGLMALSAVSAASACPKGTHPHGGTGTHHKGGWCS